MPLAEQHFRWTWGLRAPPEALWPLVSDTDRFNRDCGYPAVTVIPPPPGNSGQVTNTRRLSANAGGVAVEWDERAFEWIAPTRFGVERVYHRGPLGKMVMSCELTPRADGGTTLVYDMLLTPANMLGRVALPFVIGRKARAITEKIFRRYDEFALRGLRTSQFAAKPSLSSGGERRLAAAKSELLAAEQPPALVDRLVAFIRTADDFAAARIRPYAVADEWNESRAATLKLFLHATRGGVLDLSWDLICPHCRGAKASRPTLSRVNAAAHCDSCNVDFTANFDQSVELSFMTNAAVRPVTRVDYCVGGPQITPHILAQQVVPPRQEIFLSLNLAPGRYRVRTPGKAEQAAFRVVDGGSMGAELRLGEKLRSDLVLDPHASITVLNDEEAEQLAIVESLSWSDQSATAAEVTSLQIFRDLFSQEVLRPGEQISVGSMTVAFTDLKDSTRLYREIGDAPAFGRVLTHFEILKAAVAAENGAIVKTMGDAVMAVFPRPIAAVRAMWHAREWLAAPQDHPLPEGVNVPPSSVQPLSLKAGIHCGPCLAINQNDRLDYFGTTVNITARLCGLSQGTDLVLSDRLCADAEVQAWLAEPAHRVAAKTETATLKGLGDEAFCFQRANRV